MVRAEGKHVHDRPIIQPTWLLAFRLLRQEADRYIKALIAFALLLVLTVSALTALSPVLLKLIVDHLSDHGPLDGAYPALGLLVAVYAVGHWLTRSLRELQALAIGRVDQRLHRRLSFRTFKHLIELPLRFHLDRKTGALSQTLANGLVGYRLLIQHMVQTVLPAVVELGLMCAVLLLLGQPIFLGIIGASLGCYAFAFSLGARRLAMPARAVSAAHIDANALLTDNILNYETIKSFCAERHVHRRMEKAFTRTEARWARFFTRKALNGVLAGTIFAVSLGTTGWIAARAVQEGHMTIGDFVLVNSYMLQIFRPIEMLGLALRDIAQGIAFIEKMIELLRLEREPLSRDAGDPLPPGAGTLTFDKVTFSYSKERQILRNISFNIPPGKTVAIVGASGSGKSSLIRLLVRFWEPDSGQILIDGMNISKVSVSSLRQAIAVVPQDTVLFNDTIAYNIAGGRAGISKRDIVDAARLAQIHDFIMTRPDGYRTVVGERGLKLSGGEKQRIAIARAAVKKPRIFVFDEATSSLDSRTEQQILRNFNDVSRGRTTLIIAHRLSTIVGADEILVLNDGQILERGTHPDLLQHSRVYRAMWAAQQHNHEGPYEIAI